MQIGVPLIFKKAFLWLYETGLNVGVYRKLLVWIGWENLSKASNPVKKNRAALEKLEYQTRQSEFGHLIIFIVVAVFGIAVALL